MHKEEIVTFLKKLRDEIIAGFLTLETEGTFVKTPWDYKRGEGGGEISLLKGAVFEKAAVNWSGIHGNCYPFDDGGGSFFATGVSLITHMQNPMAPTAHMNVRYIETEKGAWFGGGYDLTPMGFIYEEDKSHFHKEAEKALLPFGDQLYEKFSAEAKRYFFVPHRNKERGVGGIFFDHYQTGHFEKDIAMWKSVGNSFLKAILPIYQKRVHLPYTEEDKKVQNRYRAHYVEFNLIYDRGTKFGFQSGGNPEAILCSMPPHASWV